MSDRCSCGHEHNHEEKNTKINMFFYIIALILFATGFIPALSNIMQPMPTALELNLTFNQGYIMESLIKQIYFGEQDIILHIYEEMFHFQEIVSENPKHGSTLII